MKDKMRKMFSVVLTLALLLTGVAVPDLSGKASAAGSKAFKMYFYYETEAKLYMNIWNHAAVDFAEGAETEDAFGWGTQQAVLQPVEGNVNWYSADLTILDASAEDGLSIYNGADESNKVAEYDNQWNNTADYATLVGGSKDAYAVKDGMLFTNLGDAGLNLDVTPGTETSLDDLKALVAAVPADYEKLGFAEDSTAAVKKALETANAPIAGGSSDAAALDAAFNALSDALDGLVFASDIFVQKIDNYDENSIRGMDVSSYLSIMKSFEKVVENKRAAGASEEEIKNIGFKNWDGTVLDEQGFLTCLRTLV